MKRIYSLLMVLLVSIITHAVGVKIGNLYYNLDDVSKTAEVTYQSYPLDNYTNLLQANIPSTVTQNGITYRVIGITHYAFSSCEKLSSVSIPNSVTSIGDYAFYNCKSLQTITIPNTVTSIGMYVFFSCTALQTISIPNSVTVLKQGVFQSCSNLSTIVLSSNITTIEDWVFGGCTNLNYIRIPDKIESIGTFAFCNCQNLRTITIPNSVTYIGDFAFEGCTNMTSAVLGSNINKIGKYAFFVCDNLTFVTCYNSTPPEVGDSAFGTAGDHYKIPLYVPENSIELYKSTAEWKEFNPILPIDSAHEEVDHVTFKVAPNKILQDGMIIINSGNKKYSITGNEL